MSESIQTIRLYCSTWQRFVQNLYPLCYSEWHQSGKNPKIVAPFGRCQLTFAEQLRLAYRICKSQRMPFCEDSLFSSWFSFNISEIRIWLPQTRFCGVIWSTPLGGPSCLPLWLKLCDVSFALNINNLYQVTTHMGIQSHVMKSSLTSTRGKQMPTGQITCTLSSINTRAAYLKSKPTYLLRSDITLNIDQLNGCVYICTTPCDIPSVTTQRRSFRSANRVFWSFSYWHPSRVIFVDLSVAFNFTNWHLPNLSSNVQQNDLIHITQFVKRLKNMISSRLSTSIHLAIHQIH